MRTRIETQETTLTEREPPGDPGELRLLVSADGVLNAHVLGGRATVRIGRGGDNDVDVPHPSVSRRHAELVVEPLAVRDLGSSNGTVVRGGRIEPGILVPVAVGEAIHIGDVAVLLQRVARTEAVRPPPEARFERLLAGACARAARTGTPFAVARVHVDGGGDGLADRVAAAFSLADTVIETAPGQCQLLLADGDPARAAAAVQRACETLTAGGLVATSGVAAWPYAGVTAEQLAAQAWQRSISASSSTAAASEEAGGAQPEPTAMDGVRALAAQVADSQLSVLVRGETGVGKELCAEMIHRLSSRRARPFLKVNCAALSDGLLESELFGHERGAFTGATATKPGLLEIAAGGTVFFDEIGEMPLALQAKLLHVLEDRVVKRVGGVEARAVDIRFVAATNRTLEREISSGRFRQDLYFRLAGVTIEVPPLRQRPGEIEGLARAFAAFACQAARRPTPALAPDAIAALLAHGWPGNIRELRHTIERSILLCGDGPLHAHHLRMGAVPAPVPETLHPRDLADPVPANEPDPAASSRAGARLHDQVADLERERIREALEACGGNQSHAARMLGIARGTLRARMREFGLGPRR